MSVPAYYLIHSTPNSKRRDYLVNVVQNEAKRAPTRELSKAVAQLGFAALAVLPPSALEPQVFSATVTMLESKMSALLENVLRNERTATFVAGGAQPSGGVRIQIPGFNTSIETPVAPVEPVAVSKDGQNWPLLVGLGVVGAGAFWFLMRR